MGRYQRGYVFQRSGAYHVRYYVTEIVDGKPQKVQRSERLCSKDNKHHSTTCKAVQQLAAGVMGRINAMSGSEPQRDLTVSDFWEQTYLPHIKKTTKASTLHGYKAIWRQHLEAVFAGFNLRDYQTHHATRYLTSLADKGLGPKTIAHIRSLASGMFKHALRLNHISVNPWREAGSLTPIKKPKSTHAYTLEEAEAIGNALVNNPPAQIVFCLAAFMGLRPGEISALKWTDIEWHNDATGTGWIHIRRSAWRSIVDTPKTEESIASVPLIEPVKSMLLAWKVQATKKPSGAEWVFPNRSNNPMQMEGFQKRIIAPVLAADADLKKKGIEWHGLYAGRRSAATLLVQLTGNAVAAQFVLRHKNLTTTTAFYVKPVQSAGLDGMKLVEVTLANRKALAESNGK